MQQERNYFCTKQFYVRLNMKPSIETWLDIPYEEADFSDPRMMAHCVLGTIVPYS